MSNKPEAGGCSQPALLPLHGFQDKKPRFLDREAIVIGRSRGCDVSLDAPDVSQVHCLVTRSPDGFRIRDCNSRAGIRSNGESVRSAPLRDGDIVQIGPFSFTAFIPDSYRLPAKLTHQSDLERLQRSRRRLALLALRTRRKLAKVQTRGLAVTPTDLGRKASELKAQIRTFDQRLSSLEETERDLAQDREALECEREAQQAHVQQVELELCRRLEEVELQIRQRWQEFQQRCRQEETAFPTQSVEELRSLEERLSGRERRLREQEDQLAHGQRHLAQALEALHQKEREINSMLERTNGHRTAHELDNDSALSRLEAGLEQQRQEMARMMADLTRMQQAMRSPAPPAPDAPDADLEAILHDNERLRDEVRELQRKLSAAPADDSRKLREENVVLRQLLEAQPSAAPVQAEERQHEIEALNRLLQEKEAEIAALKTPTPGPMRETDLESYESELNHFRQQLEQDRVKLNKEFEQLRIRNTELDEATREMEMEMSRERAELGRERQRLDRLREDVRVEMERIQREGGVRESLANVNKLREEMNKKQGANPLNDRLKNLRSQLSE